jgi:hypothetical protein
MIDFALEPMLDFALARYAAYLLNFVGQYPAALRRTLFAADLKPALALAGVLPCAGVFRRCTKALPLAAVDAAAPDLNGFGAFASVRNDPTADEQECYGGRDRERLRIHFQIVAPDPR